MPPQTSNHPRCASFSLCVISCLLAFLLRDLCLAWQPTAPLPSAPNYALFLIPFLSLGAAFAREESRSFRRFRRLLLLLTSVLPFLFVIALRQGSSFQPWFVLVILATAFNAGAEGSTFIRQLGLLEEASQPLAPHVLIWVSLSVSLPLTLTPYFGPLPSCLCFSVLIAYWHGKTTEELGLLEGGMLSFLPAMALGLLLTGLWPFLSQKGYQPIDSACVGESFFSIERHQRVGSLCVRGPGTYFLSSEAHRLGEALVYPALSHLPARARLLLIGGEDAIALKALLDFPAIAHIKQLTLAPDKRHFFATHPLLRHHHNDAYADPRLHTRAFRSAFALISYLRKTTTVYDHIIHQLPPDREGHPLHIAPFFQLLSDRLAPQGRLALFTGQLGDARSLACSLQQLKDADLFTRPYRGFGIDISWGFVLAAHRPFALSPSHLPTGGRYITPTLFPQLISFPPDIPLICRPTKTH